VGNCLIDGKIRDLAMFNLAHLVSDWIGIIGLDPYPFGTHLLRRTKATLIYRRTGNLRAVQLLLGRIKSKAQPCRHLDAKRSWPIQASFGGQCRYRGKEVLG
jgi:hypothetical protein